MNPRIFSLVCLPVFMVSSLPCTAAPDRNWDALLGSLESVKPVLAGEARVNLRPIRYALYAGFIPSVSLERVRDIIGREAREGSALVANIPAGLVRVAAVKDAGRTLLLASLEGRKPWFAVALLDSDLALVARDGSGDAPGREPAGWPRIGSLRRILHVAGEGHESAIYRGRGGACELVRGAARELAGCGWRITARTEHSISALGPKGQGLALYAEEQESHTDLLVLASPDFP